MSQVNHLNVVIKNSEPTHLRSIAKCHCSSFPSSLATALGRRYCAHMLSWYLSSDKTFLFHIEEGDGQCSGYCGGMISDGMLRTGSASGMAQHSFYHAIWAFLTHPWVLFHKEVRNKWPLLIKNMAMKLGLRKKTHLSQEQKNTLKSDPKVGLVVIGVDPAYQGKGYGSALLKEFERRALEEHGIRKLQLTVRTDNSVAIKAYLNNGWIKVSVDPISTTMEKNL